MAVHALDERLAALERTGDHDNAVALHHAHGHGDAPVTFVREGLDPGAFLTRQGNERLSHAEHAGILGHLAQVALDGADLPRGDHNVAGQQRLLHVYPLPCTLDLCCVTGAEALDHRTLRCDALYDLAHLGFLARGYVDHVPRDLRCDTRLLALHVATSYRDMKAWHRVSNRYGFAMGPSPRGIVVVALLTPPGPARGTIPLGARYVFSEPSKPDPRVNPYRIVRKHAHVNHNAHKR